MITKQDIEECEAWIDANAANGTFNVQRPTSNAQPETSSEPTHPDEPAAHYGADASVLPLATHGAAPAPAAPSLALVRPHPGPLPQEREKMPRADQIMELARMRECVRLLAEEIENGWQRIIEEQQRLGWPDFDLVRDATSAIHKETQSLDNQVFESVFKLRWKPQGK